MPYLAMGAHSQPFDLQPQQAPEVRKPFTGPRLACHDPPAQRCRVDKENVPGDEGGRLPPCDLAPLLRPSYELLDAVDQALADTQKCRSLLAARIKGQLLQQD